MIKRAAQQGRTHVEVNAGELHRMLGGYPAKAGRRHSMPSCCNAMRQMFDPERDSIIYETASGIAPALTIRYAVPR